MNRGGAEGVAPALERPVVVVGSYPLEEEVSGAAGAQDRREAGCGGAGVVGGAGGWGDGEAVGKEEEELEGGYSTEYEVLAALQIVD